MNFLAMTKSIAQITSNYMNGEQLACDTWSNYINKSHIPMEDAISFLRLSIARKHSTAHIIYTDDGSMAGISSEAHADDSHIIIKTRVTDTGIGIKEEDLKKLCSPYERIEESRNRNIEGTGLGMSIVTKLLAAMGSSLVVKSVYGKGSVFSFDVMQEVRGWKELGDWREHREEALKSVEHYKESF